MRGTVDRALLVCLVNSLPQLRERHTFPAIRPLWDMAYIFQQGSPQEPDTVPVVPVDRLLRVHRCTGLKHQPSVQEVDELPLPVFTVRARVRVESGSDVVVHAALVCLSQLVRFRFRAVGEELFERLKGQVTNPEADFPSRGHILAPHGSAEFISSLMAGADDAVLCPDEDSGLVSGGLLDDNVVGVFTDARQAADPDIFGQ